MFKQLTRNIKERKYFLLYNENKLNITVTRVKGFKEFINKVAKQTKFKEGIGYFIYNEKNFASFGVSEILDLVFVNWEGKVILIEEEFDMNKISKTVKNTKYIYILPKNTIKKNKILLNNTLTHMFERKKSQIKISDFI